MRLIFACLLLLTLVRPAIADGPHLSLVMFDAPDCEFCAAWEADIGGIYAKTEEGAAAPLRRAAAFQAPPHSMTLNDKIRYSPTFVLLRDSVEVARIEGYPGEDHFWGLLGMALKRATAKLPLDSEQGFEQ